MKKIFILLFFLLTASIFAQKVSEKQDIAVFRPSYHGWSVPEFMMETLDEEVMKCFYSLKRFNIIAMEHRISAPDFDSFNQEILAMREKNLTVPEEVLMGQEAFTKADWEQTVSAYYLIVPIVSDWSLEIDTEHNEALNIVYEKYKGIISIDFHIYSMENNGEEVACLKLYDKYIQMEKKISYDIFTDSRREKMYEPSSNIAYDLERALRGTEVFRIQTGIINTERRKIVFELGKDIGINKGDEYVAIDYDEDNNEKEVGLFVVTDTEESLSKALTLYKKRQVVLGDQIKEVPRLPVEFRFDLMPEVSVMNGGLSIEDFIFSLGMHISHTRGFYRIRPCYGIEVNILSELPPEIMFFGVPMTITAGLELGNTYLGRLQFLPTVEGYFSMLVIPAGNEEGEENEKYIPIPLEVGGKAYLHTSFLITRDIKLGLSTGVKMGVKLLDTKTDPLTVRLILGFGVTVKF